MLYKHLRRWQQYNISVPLDPKATCDTRLILNIIYVWKLNQTMLELDFWAVKYIYTNVCCKKEVLVYVTSWWCLLVLRDVPKCSSVLVFVCAINQNISYFWGIVLLITETSSIRIYSKFPLSSGVSSEYEIALL